MVRLRVSGLKNEGLPTGVKSSRQSCNRDRGLVGGTKKRERVFELTGKEMARASAKVMWGDKKKWKRHMWNLSHLVGGGGGGGGGGGIRSLRTRSS